MTQNSNLKPFRYDLVIHAENQQQADRIMVERIGYDEDLREQGVGAYTIDADPIGGRELDPVEVGSEDDGRIAPVISAEGPIRGVNGEQYFSVMRINKALGGGYILPEVRRGPLEAGASSIELIINNHGYTMRIRLDDDGGLFGMDLNVDEAWEAMEGGPLHAQVVKTLSETKSA